MRIHILLRALPEDALPKISIKQSQQLQSAYTLTLTAGRKN